MNRDEAPPRLLSRRRGAAPVSTTPRSANMSATFSDEAGPSTSTTPAAWGSASFGVAAPATSAAAAPTFGSLKWTAPTPAVQAPVAPPASAFGAGSAQPSYAFAPPAGAAAAAPAPPAIGQAGSGLGRFMRARESPAPTAGPSGGITSLSGGRNAMGAAVEFDAERKQRFDSSSANRYPELKVQREAARERYIRLGVLPDPSKALDLAAASNLRGTCMDMCPAFEIAEREHQNEGDALEMVSGTSRIDPAYAVKIYRRPAAGRELPLPDDIRPPAVLRRTLDYLFHTMLPASPDELEFANVQGFIWNRTRAVRQDFIVQGQSSPLTIECHERIARYHILCLHWKGGRGAEEWSEQQELEQLRKTVRSLTEFYADMRSSTGRSAPNEAEFRAYSLMLHHRDPDTLREVEHLPASVFDAPILQAALRLRGYAQGAGPDKPRGGAEGSPNLWSRFFKEVRGPNVPYLLACLAENIFPVVRAGATRAMESAYMAQHAPMPVDELQSVLATDDAQETLDFAKSRGYIEVSAVATDGKQSVAFSIGRGQEKRALTDADIAKGKESPFSESLVEAKRGSWTCQEVVDGVASGATALLNDDLGQPLPPLFHPPRQVARRASAAARENASQLQQLPQQADPWSGPSKWAPVASAAAPPPSAAAQAFAARVAAASAPPPAVARQAATSSTLPTQKPPVTSSASVWGTSKPQFGSASGSSSGSAPAPAAKATTAAARVAASPYKKPTTSSSSSTPSFISFKAASAPTATNGASNGATPKLKANRTSDASGEAAAVSVAAPGAVAADVAPSPGAGPAKKSKKADDATSSLLATPAVSAAIRQRTEEASKAAELAHARREEDTRTARVEAVVQGLLDEGVEEVLALKLEEAAEYAAAATLRGRALFRATLRVWTARLDDRRARADETRRLDHVRQDLKRRALGRSTAGEELAEESWGKRSILYGEAHAQQPRAERVPATSAATRMDDSALQQQLADARSSRDELWAPGTWLDALAKRVEDLTPPSGEPRHVRSWDVTLDTAGNGAGSQWLRNKLDLERSSIDSRFDSRLGPRRRDLKVFIEGAETSLPFQETLGLVIFERSPQGDSRDAARLRRLRDGVAAARRNHVPWLLVVAWSEEPSDMEVLQELGYETGDVWAGVSIMRLTNAEDQTDVNFKVQLERLITSIVWAEDARRIPVTRLFDQLLHPLYSAFHCLEDLLRRLSATRAPSSDSDRRLAARAFATVVLLLNNATESVEQICEYLSEEYADLPDVRLSPFDWQTLPDSMASADAMLYERVAEYLDEDDLLAECPQDASLALLTSMLATAKAQQQPFPLAACGEQLFAIVIAALQDSGARVDEQAEHEFRDSARRFDALASEAVKELVEEERSLRRTRRIASSQSSKSIGSGTVPTLGKRSAAKALAATETSTSPAKKFRASASVSGDAPSTAVASLRALMADVEQLIDAGGRDA